MVKKGEYIVKKGKELLVSSLNMVGLLGRITEVLSKADINIGGISGYIVNDTAFFRLLTSDNVKAKRLLSKEGFKVEEKEVVIVNLPNKSGELYKFSSKIGKKGIDLNYIYGTTSGDEGVVVLSSLNNDEIIELF